MATARASNIPLDYNCSMTRKVKSLLTKLKQGLTDLYGPRLKAVILFGSYARGDYDLDSDLDVLIVLDAYKSRWDELVRSAELASNLSLEYGVTISRTILSEDQWKQGEWPILVNVRAEGIPV